ncbi:MAG: phosphoenolpyruvate carboxykinase (ATP) [Deltaproteobacteria bacterium]|nr:phosphoenolpyruvate carboxykinase (ATP) [Deltaproteobacteria bacterium]
MEHQGQVRSQQGLEAHGIRNANTVWWNLSTPALYEHAIQRHEGLLAHLGPLVVRTGQYTGRSPNDRFVVQEPSSQDKMWWGKVNQPFTIARYDALRARLTAYLQGKDLYVQDCYVGADPTYRLPIRVINELAWHNLFARNMFLQEPDLDQLAQHQPQFTVIDAPGFNASPEDDGTRSEAFILLHFGRREVIVGGTAYAGEMKKSLFTVMNYLLPPQGVLSMHCSANYGKDENDVAIFFGLSGTGKTTLSADPQRTLIGDDEHGWSDHGVFNFEGGCYAKVIRLSPTGEPEIYETTRRFGTILENVAIDTAARRLDLDSDDFTENTRAAYPISHIPNATRTGRGGHPQVIIMLTADAFGVLPPIARLSPAQAMYHFLSGYTAKVAGTERGITEPQATFSACFGSPFMALNPGVYAELLGKKIAQHQVQVWLVNTGWSGGPYGVGQRMKLAYTRAMVSAALNGTLAHAPMSDDPFFGVQIPQTCPDVPPEVLPPRKTWRDPQAYDAQARKLAGMFTENFKQFANDVSPDIRAAGPRTA